MVEDVASSGGGGGVQSGRSCGTGEGQQNGGRSLVLRFEERGGPLLKSLCLSLSSGTQVRVATCCLCLQAASFHLYLTLSSLYRSATFPLLSLAYEVSEEKQSD